MSTGVHSAGASGHHVEGYVLRRFLAQGGMAELFLARPTDPAHAREVVVVKRVLPQFAQDIQFARMFAREAALASMLKHPNIVEVFGSEGINEHECFFAMEYVHGPDLNGLLKQLKERQQPMPLEHALQVAIGMCAGLHHAHEKRGDDGHVLGIVHRDVSPSNVMISSEGAVKITDFGVAKALALTSFTQAGTRKGKLSYMSPEQAVADPVDRRTDIFAIGTVLFEMTTLQRMFGGENELAVMHKLLFRERPRPSAVRHDYPPELESIVMRAVAQQPENRYDSAEQMQQALMAFAQRRGLQCSAAGLGAWVATVLSPTPHPAQDPSFFTSDDPSGVIPIPSRGGVTIADGGSQTVADSFPDSATVMDGSGPLMPVAGHVVAADSIPGAAVPGRLHGPPDATGGSFGSAPPAPVYPAAPLHAPSGPITASRRAPAPNSNVPAFAIVGGAVALAAMIFGGAVWYASVRDQNAAKTEIEAESMATPPRPDAEPRSPSAASVEKQDQPPTPAPDDPEPAEAQVPPEVQAPPDAAAAPTAPPETSLPSADGARTGSGSRKGKRKRKRSAAAAGSGPSTPPVKTPPPAVEEPKKKKNPLDELFPGG